MIKLSRFLCAAALFAFALVAQPAFADPPGRVGRISLLSGSATFRDLAGGEDSAAIMNWPVTSQNAIVTSEDGRAEVRIGSTAVRLDRDSELHFIQLDDQHIKLYLASGSATVRVRSRDAARDFELTTRQGQILLLEPGRYRLTADQARDSTAVSVFQGTARVDAAEASVPLRSGERVELWDGGYPNVVRARADDFDDWSLSRDRRDEASRSARYVSPEMTGYEDLDEHGYWEQSGDYGPVWYPRSVATGWAPYRSGHWAWVAPWGWTWIDEAPWGFAPFHYGRWVTIGGVWAWAPGAIAARPVYAPALVAWVGRPGWNASVSFGSAPAVGWFPLAPREVYYPGYRCSPTYVRNVNVAHVTNVTQITNITQHNVALTNVRYRHQHTPQAVTVVPTDVVVKGSPVKRAMLREADTRTIAALPVAAAPSAVAPALAAPRPFAGRRHSPESAAQEGRMKPGLPGVAPSAQQPPQVGDNQPARGAPRVPDAGPPHGLRARDEERRQPAAADPQALMERGPRSERDRPRDPFPSPRREAVPQAERPQASPSAATAPSPRARDEERRPPVASDPASRAERGPRFEREMPRDAFPAPRREAIQPSANVPSREQIHEQRHEQRREYRRPEPPAAQPPRSAMPSPAPSQMEQRLRIEARPEPRFDPRLPPRVEPPAPRAQGGPTPGTESGPPRHRRGPEGERQGPGGPRMQ